MKHASRCLALAVLTLAACSSDRSSPTAPTTPAAPQPMTAPQPLTATYSVTFDATWSSRTHPVDAPASPHFSPLIGVTHDATVTFWADGLLASRGIENMAELGATSPLDNEFENAVNAKSAEQILRGSPIFPSPGKASLDFTASQSHPLVTLVSMVAPSPDWFVGVSRLNLFAGGVWAEEVVVDLVPWDAGTDSGTTFESPDVEAVPHRPIALIRTAPLAPSGTAAPLGTFSFRRTG